MTEVLRVRLVLDDRDLHHLRPVAWLRGVIEDGMRANGLRLRVVDNCPELLIVRSYPSSWESSATPTGSTRLNTCDGIERAKGDEEMRPGEYCDREVRDGEV